MTIVNYDTPSHLIKLPMAIHEIVKYNPINYLNGVYITEEWSSKSDIGKIFNGHKFTINEYMQTEREYIDAVKIIMFS